MYYNIQYVEISDMRDHTHAPGDLTLSRSTFHYWRENWRTALVVRASCVNKVVGPRESESELQVLRLFFFPDQSQIIT